MESYRSAMAAESYAPDPDNINHHTWDRVTIRKLLVFLVVIFMAIIISTPQNAGKL